MKCIVLDLEATCWEKMERRPHEIIEIGAVCIDEEKNILGEFVQFIKPKLNPILSPFCTQLTSISQDMIDSAPMFPQGLQNFQDWIHSYDEDYVLASWGFFDRTQFKRDCVLHDLDTSWLLRHFSLKHQYTRIKGEKNHKGMAKALKKEQMTLDGTHHRGIDDARNMTKIYLKYFDEWILP